METSPVSHVASFAWLTSFCERQPNGCLTYMRARSPFGYGVVRHDGKTWRAHRLAWHLVCGPIPQGLHLLHHCDNPPCLEVAHLYLGTQSQNMQDRLSRGRGLGVPLSDEQRYQIATRYEHQHVRPKTPGNSCKELCAEFGVSQKRLLKVVREFWEDFDGE